MPIPQGVHEIREHGYSFALLVSTIVYFWSKRSTIEAEASREIALNPAPSNPEISLSVEGPGDKA
jgi:hypothetical protein